MTFDPVRTADGSSTLRHLLRGELYHAREGAVSEALAKFINPSGLTERLRQGKVRLLEVGLGLGVNCRAALALSGGLEIDTVEAESEALEGGLFLNPGDPLLLALRDRGIYVDGTRRVCLHLGDIRRVVREIAGPYDLIFHDPFSPLKNTECWTVDLFAEMYRILKKGGALLTYSESRLIRGALREAGFVVAATAAVPPQRGGTLALREPEIAPIPLPETAFDPFPYRDPGLCTEPHDIRARRELAVRQAASKAAKV